MSHEDHYDPVQKNMGRIYVIATLLNIAFVIVEFSVGLYTHSSGLLADAGHNLSDVGSLLIFLVAFLLAKKHFSRNYTYGFRKATIHASLLNAAILLVAVGAIIMTCVQKLIHPAAVNGFSIIVTAGAGIIINGVTVLLFMRDKAKDLNVKGAYLHMLADTFVSVGVVVSGIIILFTGWTIIDPLIGLLISVVILGAGWGLMKESLRLSLDGIPEGVDIDKIRTHLLGNDNVVNVHHLHIWPISTMENALTAHVVLKDISELENTKRALHAEMAEHGITHSTLEFEVSGSNCKDSFCQ